MAERQNTLTCAFDPKSPRVSAFEIHEWIHDQLRIPENEVQMIQIDGPRRQVFIKMKQCNELYKIIQETNGQKEYKHSNGEISQVKIEMAGLGNKRIRIANLPPEVPEGSIRSALAKYGEIKSIQEESWSKAYRYAVSNGIKIATMALKKHIPSHTTIAGHRVLIAYEGQPMTCYGCNAIDHVYQTCPKRLETSKGRKNEQTITWAHVARHGTQKTNDGEQQQKNQPTNNSEPKDEVHNTEEGTGMDAEPEGSIQVGLGIPIEQEQDSQKTGSNSRCNMDFPGTNDTVNQDNRDEEDGKSGGEHVLGSNPLQVENQKQESTEWTIGNKTTERINTNCIDQTNNDPTQIPQGEMEEVQEERNIPQRPKKLKLEGNGEPSTERKRSRTRNATSKKDK